MSACAGVLAAEQATNARAIAQAISPAPVRAGGLSNGSLSSAVGGAPASGRHSLWQSGSLGYLGS